MCYTVVDIFDLEVDQLKGLILLMDISFVFLLFLVLCKLLLYYLFSKRIPAKLENSAIYCTH